MTPMQIKKQIQPLPPKVKAWAQMVALRYDANCKALIAFKLVKNHSAVLKGCK